MTVSDNIDILLLNLPISGTYKSKLDDLNSMPPLGLLYVGTILKNNGKASM